MMYSRVRILVVLLAGFVITVIYGDSVKRGFIDTRSKRGLTSEAAKVLLAWRKLLWNAKPGVKRSHAFDRYYKEGNFGNAAEDFLSVVPANNKLKFRGDTYKGRIYEATIGEWKIVLRERGNYGVNHPTIEISNGKTKDKIIYRDTKLNKRL